MIRMRNGMLLDDSGLDFNGIPLERYDRDMLRRHVAALEKARALLMPVRRPERQGMTEEEIEAKVAQANSRGYR